MNSLSSYIDAQRSAGSFESAGSFTLALEKASEKLRSHSLANPEDYILKLVQCVARLAVTELHIKLLKQSVMVFFETDAANRTVSVDAVARALSAPLEETDPARAYLALALCAVSGQSPRELMWGEWDEEGRGGTILSLAEGRSEVFREAPFPRVEPLAKGRRFFLFFLTKRSSGLPLGQMAAEHCAITRRCALAPMPIILDGMPLQPSLPVVFSPSDPASQLTSPYLGALEIVSLDESKRLRWPAAKGTSKAWRTLPDELTEVSPALPPVFRMRIPRDFETPMLAQSQITAAYGLPVYLYGSSSITYVKDGVMLHPVKTHDNGGGAFAVLDGEHVKTDLTGLQVVVDSAVEQDIASTAAVWQVLVDRMTSTPPPVYSNKPIYAKGSTFVTLFGCCLLGPLGLIVGPIYALFSSRSAKQAQLQRKLTRQLEVRRGYLSFKSRKADATSRERADDGSPTGREDDRRSL